MLLEVLNLGGHILNGPCEEGNYVCVRERKRQTLRPKRNVLASSVCFRRVALGTFLMNHELNGNQGLTEAAGSIAAAFMN